MPLSLRQLAETAALVSSKANLIIESRAGISEPRLQAYWTNCRSRTLAWIQQLDGFACQLNEEDASEHPRLWTELEPLLNEIFVSEILTRVWAAVLTASDQTGNKKLAAPIARHTVTSHIDVRNRAMSLMLSGPQISLAELARVDRVRRKAERWSDILIGPFVTRYRLEELAFDLQRSVEFANGQMREIIKATDEPVWEFVLAGVRIAFASLDHSMSVCQANQSAILSAVIGSFPPDLFNEMGIARSAMHVRMERGPSSDVSPFRAAPLPVPETTSSRRLNFAALRTRHGAE